MVIIIGTVIVHQAYDSSCDPRRRGTGNLVNGHHIFRSSDLPPTQPGNTHIYRRNSFDFIKSNKLSSLGIPKHFTLPINNAIAADSIYERRENARLKKRGATWPSSHENGYTRRCLRSFVTVAMKTGTRYSLIETLPIHVTKNKKHEISYKNMYRGKIHRLFEYREK